MYFQPNLTREHFDSMFWFWPNMNFSLSETLCFSSFLPICSAFHLCALLSFLQLLFAYQSVSLSMQLKKTERSRTLWPWWGPCSWKHDGSLEDVEGRVSVHIVGPGSWWCEHDWIFDNMSFVPPNPFKWDQKRSEESLWIINYVKLNFIFFIKAANKASESLNTKLNKGKLSFWKSWTVRVHNSSTHHQQLQRPDQRRPSDGKCIWYWSDIDWFSSCHVFCE